MRVVLSDGKESKEYEEVVARGQLTVKLSARTRVIIDELYVGSEFRRMKLGSRLLSTITSSFCPKTATIEVVPRPFGYGEKMNLEDLKKFYAKCGFVLLSTTSPVMFYKPNK